MRGGKTKSEILDEVRETLGKDAKRRQEVYDEYKNLSRETLKTLFHSEHPSDHVLAGTYSIAIRQKMSSMNATRVRWKIDTTGFFSLVYIIPALALVTAIQGFNWMLWAGVALLWTYNSSKLWSSFLKPYAIILKEFADHDKKFSTEGAIFMYLSYIDSLDGKKNFKSMYDMMRFMKKHGTIEGLRKHAKQ